MILIAEGIMRFVGGLIGAAIFGYLTGWAFGFGLLILWGMLGVVHNETSAGKKSRIVKTVIQSILLIAFTGAGLGTGYIIMGSICLVGVINTEYPSPVFKIVYIAVFIATLLFLLKPSLTSSRHFMDPKYLMARARRREIHNAQ